MTRIAFHSLSNGAIAVVTEYGYREFPTLREARAWAQQALAVCALMEIVRA